MQYHAALILVLVLQLIFHFYTSANTSVVLCLGHDRYDSYTKSRHVDYHIEDDSHRQHDQHDQHEHEHDEHHDEHHEHDVELTREGSEHMESEHDQQLSDGERSESEESQEEYESGKMMVMVR